MIVVDTNVISYLFLPGSHSMQAESLLRKDPDWAAPFLWRSEFRNVLALYMRKSLISFHHAMLLSHEAENLMQGREYEVSFNNILLLLSKSSLSAYDCEFVGLAQELECPLITSDAAILKEFPSIAVPLARHEA